MMQAPGNQLRGLFDIRSVNQLFLTTEDLYLINLQKFLVNILLSFTTCIYTWYIFWQKVYMYSYNITVTTH